jgi:protein-S-isoprenylcysteine O-methyltransferase
VFVLLFDVPPQWAWLHRRIVPNTNVVLFTGVALTVLGVAFAIWARLALGTNWSSRATIKQGHELIIRGPYRIVRNPIYTGIFFALLGTALALGQVRHFLGLPILLLGWVWKITTEQRLLRAQFGESYERYCKEVKAFIPYVI